MIKKILVTQDGSRFSKAALDYGVWLGRRFGAGLVGFHVVDLVALEGPFLHDISGSMGFEPYLNFSTKMREALEERGNTILGAFSEECAKAGVPFETQLTVGVVPNEVCEKAKLADLVIVGRRGMNARFEYELHGSTAESVVRKSPKPVLVVPDEFKEPKKALLAYDGSENASRAMHSAAEWSKVLELPLTVVSVSPEPQDPLLAEAQSYIKPYGIEAKFVRLSGEPPVAIAAYYKDNAHDLLFMGTHRHSRLVEMVLGSTTEHVMRRVTGPFFLER